MKNYKRDILVVIFLSILLAGVICAQTTSIQIPTADTSSSFRITDNNSSILLRLNGDAGFYLGGSIGSGIIPKTGGGTRLMWCPNKAAFRSGQALAAEWDNSNIGNQSVAMGYAVRASGSASIALGYHTITSGEWSCAVGYWSEASGNSSIAMGNNALASGGSGIALGYFATASGTTSQAIGRQVTSSGSFSTALGNYVSTGGYTGSFIIGDNSGTIQDTSTNNNQMTMRFAGGYRLFSNAAGTAGVYMNGGVNGWTNYCDRNKKENFHQVDGEQLLMKIHDLPVTQWNYKGTDPTVRYIGPAAQDFYTAFRLGGTDSLGINSICIDGVNIAAIKALEKRTVELKTAVDELQKEKEKVAMMEERIRILEQALVPSR